MAKTSLKALNTFGVEASCEQLLSFSSSQELSQWLSQEQNQDEAVFILGGGSNLLLHGHLHKTVIQPNFQQINYKQQTDSVLVTAGAGVNWHQLVMETIDKGYSGLENLSLIPGNVGAAPIQNIGAYGVELESRFVELSAIEIATGRERTFDKADCHFAYRDSVFKGALKGQYVISSVTLRLDKNPKFVLNYGPLKELKEKSQAGDLTVKEVSQAVIRIRQSKLPDPAVLGNAGSFFKNPLVSEITYTRLTSTYPELVAYPQADNKYKLAAGWLIDQAGLKGTRVGDAGVHEKQALVLVNHGEATSEDLLQLAGTVRDKVWQKFQVELEPEVWIIGEQTVFPKIKNL